MGFSQFCVFEEIFKLEVRTLFPNLCLISLILGQEAKVSLFFLGNKEAKVSLFFLSNKEAKVSGFAFTLF